MDKLDVTLSRRADGADVFAGIRQLDAREMRKLQAQWEPCRIGIRRRLVEAGVAEDAMPEALDWEWGGWKADTAEAMNLEVWAILCGARYEAAMALEPQGREARIEPAPGKLVAFVKFLETAPWNRKVNKIGQEGEVRGAGSALIRHAVNRSRESGHGGRIGLLSLKSAEEFYRDSCAMRRFAPASKKELAYFELSGADASEYPE